MISRSPLTPQTRSELTRHALSSAALAVHLGIRLLVDLGLCPDLRRRGVVSVLGMERVGHLIGYTG